MNIRQTFASAAGCVVFGAAAVAWSAPAPPADPPAQLPPQQNGQNPPNSDPSTAEVPFARRGGLSFGVSGYGLYGRAEGYPNALSQIGNPAWKSHLVGVGGGYHLWLGGSLTDWFTFALGFAQTKMEGQSLESGSWALLFRVEGFPLYTLGSFWRDLGVSADFGTGPTFIRHKGSEDNLAYAGTVSIASFSAFWEAWRPFSGRFSLGPVALGPFAMFHYEKADSMTQTFVAIGVRAAFYGAQ